MIRYRHFKLRKMIVIPILIMTVFTSASIAEAKKDTPIKKYDHHVKLNAKKQLVVTSKNTVVKGFALYKKTLYYNGTIFTGTLNKKKYHRGFPFTGLSKKKYYKSGFLGTGLFNKKYYKSGLLGTGLFNKKYYKSGLLGTGLFNKKYYKSGLLGTGFFNNLFYNQGQLVHGFHDHTLYIHGVVATGLVSFHDYWYSNSQLASGFLLYGPHDERYYIDGLHITDSLIILDAQLARAHKKAQQSLTDFDVITKQLAALKVINEESNADKKAALLSLFNEQFHLNITDATEMITQLHMTAPHSADAAMRDVVATLQLVIERKKQIPIFSNQQEFITFYSTAMRDFFTQIGKITYPIERKDFDSLSAELGLTLSDPSSGGGSPILPSTPPAIKKSWAAILNAQGTFADFQQVGLTKVRAIDVPLLNIHLQKNQANTEALVKEHSKVFTFVHTLSTIINSSTPITSATDVSSTKDFRSAAITDDFMRALLIDMRLTNTQSFTGPYTIDAFKKYLDTRLTKLLSDTEAMNTVISYYLINNTNFFNSQTSILATAEVILRSHYTGLSPIEQRSKYLSLLLNLQNKHYDIRFDQVNKHSLQDLPPTASLYALAQEAAVTEPIDNTISSLLILADDQLVLDAYTDFSVTEKETFFKDLLQYHNHFQYLLEQVTKDHFYPISDLAAYYAQFNVDSFHSFTEGLLLQQNKSILESQKNTIEENIIQNKLFFKNYSLKKKQHLLFYYKHINPLETEISKINSIYTRSEKPVQIIERYGYFNSDYSFSIDMLDQYNPKAIYISDDLYWVNGDINSKLTYDKKNTQLFIPPQYIANGTLFTIIDENDYFHTLKLKIINTTESATLSSEIRAFIKNVETLSATDFLTKQTWADHDYVYNYSNKKAFNFLFDANPYEKSILDSLLQTSRTALLNKINTVPSTLTIENFLNEFSTITTMSPADFETFKTKIALEQFTTYDELKDFINNYS
ncbi:hypothetical protein KSI01_27350 [Kurthia sibirica]|uniref:hypothetical protein n=1 Tax=Kurthia sibirica TaxID=202750 RepID=UPI0011725532|nr:hypothetical protein [Kurthia sibirica]GEK35202.1 hypothetical protein KSI01_27350 [Kurthia sibirica]